MYKRLKQVLILLFILSGINSNLFSQQLIVNPFLQRATPTEILIIWETDIADSSYVEWGITQSYGNVTYAATETSYGAAQIHTAILGFLQSSTKYYYRIVGDTYFSDEYNFITPSPQSDESSLVIAAMSDMQRDNSYPDKFYDIVHEGILKYFDENYTGEINEHLSMVLIPGDLVVNGNTYSQWQDHFFGPSDPLFGYVPVYPVLGNHEGNSQYFYKYFNLPGNGSSYYNEHWWTRVESNVRIIGLDSNPAFAVQQQLDWLQAVLDSTVNDTNIDFVFAQLHHPHKSELWLPGESNFTGDVIERLENFTELTGKPSIHLFGHTHGYSRGQSRDHKHLWVNVATAGGNIDSWGEYAQNDYDEFNISQDEYGYVIIEVDAGSNPKFVLKRFSIGDEYITKDNSLEDSVEIRINNTKPDTPTALFPLQIDTVNPNCVILKANEYFDPNGDEHGGSHWQISESGSDFSNPIIDSWKQYENWYFEIDLQAGDDLTDEKVETLEPNHNYHWRVRYRDKSLTWSDWTDAISFHTTNSMITENLLQNPGAEDSTDFWTVEYGELESLEAGQCNGISPHNGVKYFAVGAICVEYEFASAFQQVDITNYESTVDSGIVFANYGGFLSNYSGTDIPSFALQFLDNNENLISGTDTTSSTMSSWNIKSEQWLIPIGTRILKFIMMGQRISGTDNDSYLDDVFLYLSFSGDTCSYYTDTLNTIDTYSRTNSNIRIFPNPVVTIATLNISRSFNNDLQVLIFDSNGRKVRGYNDVRAPEFIFNREGLSNGLYLIQVRDEGEVIGQVKFVVQD